MGGLVFCVRFPVGTRIFLRTKLCVFDVAYPALLKTCPKKFSFQSYKILINGWICFPGLCDCALSVSLALLSAYSLELLRCTNVVCWNAFSSLPAASVMTMTASKTNSFHFSLQGVLIQKMCRFLSMAIVAEIHFLISSSGSMCCVVAFCFCWIWNRRGPIIVGRLLDFFVAYLVGEIANRQTHLSIFAFHLPNMLSGNHYARYLESHSIQRLIIMFPMI